MLRKQVKYDSDEGQLLTEILQMRTFHAHQSILTVQPNKFLKIQHP